MQTAPNMKEQILEDAKLEIITQLNKSEGEKDFHMIESLVKNFLDECQQILSKSQASYANEFAAIKLYQKDMENDLQQICQSDRDLLLYFFNKRTEYYENERTFYLAQGLRNGVYIYFLVKDGIQGKNINEAFSKIFHPDYLDVDVYEFYLKHYGGCGQIRKAMDAIERILDSSVLSKQEYNCLSDYLLSADMIQQECKLLYDKGLSHGMKLADVYFRMRM